MTVTYRGRQVDPVALWSNYVEFPVNFTDDGSSEFSPLMVCPNPDHQTTKRHFQVNLRKPLVHCFANCGISGSYEDALVMIEGVGSREARRKIMRHSRVGGANITVRKKGAPEIIEVPTEYERFLPPVATEYLRNRGISPETQEAWGLGWDYENLRIVIPALDQKGRTAFLIRRTVKKGVEPRYLYPSSPVVHRMLFGACKIDPGVVRSLGLIVVEGSMDCMWLWQLGFRNVVAILGSKVSEIQSKRIANLRPKRIFTMFDADGAGVGATISLHSRVRGIPIQVCRYAKGHTDPAEIQGRGEAERMLSRALDYNKWYRSLPSEVRS